MMLTSRRFDFLIAEEQRHGRDLGRLMALNGIDKVKTTPTDRVFRRLRNIYGGLEMSIAVLVTAEIIAMSYYGALRRATRSVILRRLCCQILRDEVRHLQFQCGQLEHLRSKRRGFQARATQAGQRFLFLGAVLVVWPVHRRVIRRGGLSAAGWWRLCWKHFNMAFGPELRYREITGSGVVSPWSQKINSTLKHRSNVCGDMAVECRQKPNV